MDTRKAKTRTVAIVSVIYDFLLKEWPNVVTGGTVTPGSHGWG